MFGAGFVQLSRVESFTIAEGNGAPRNVASASNGLNFIGLIVPDDPHLLE